MTSQPVIAGMVVAFPVSLAYLFLHLRSSRRPELGRFVAVFLATVGAVVGALFVFEVIWLDLSPIPVLRDQKLTLVVGGIAVIWTAGEQLFKEFQRVIRRDVGALDTVSTASVVIVQEESDQDKP